MQEKGQTYYCYFSTGRENSSSGPIRELSDEAAIRELIVNWARAVRMKNLEEVLADHSPDILMFDVPPPLQSKGIEAYRKTWDHFSSWYHDSRNIDIIEMDVTAGNDVAFVTALMRCAGQRRAERKPSSIFV